MKPLKPSPSLLAKIGSVLVHIEEMTSPGGHPLDVEATRGLMNDPEVVEWMDAMRNLAFLPLKRHE